MDLFFGTRNLPPVTPPATDCDAGLDANDILDTAVHVLTTEATALSCMARLYQTDPIARNGFANAVTRITQSGMAGGKLVISGIGKSGKIGHKLVATMNSLGIQSAFLHPVEALHGDLGLVGPNDTVMLISFSGRTVELHDLVTHLPATVGLIAMTSHSHPAACPLTANDPNAVLLPAPVHETETASFGVPAPTTSTTVALALGDALAMAVARSIHQGAQKDIFRRYHPGGAIGANARAELRELTPSSGADGSVGSNEG